MMGYLARSHWNRVTYDVKSTARRAKVNKGQRSIEKLPTNVARPPSPAQLAATGEGGLQVTTNAIVLTWVNWSAFVDIYRGIQKVDFHCIKK